MKLTADSVRLSIEAARLTSEMRALEVGCGPGHASHMMVDTDTFVVVLINVSMHHFVLPEKIRAEVRRPSKTGGRFAFARPTEQFRIRCVYRGPDRPSHDG